ncbi:MAG: diguanylate cyclase [Gammaproteobacteria bacterium]|nr:diguanylate cyclase [Gammaproteobacteria bacterium]
MSPAVALADRIWWVGRTAVAGREQRHSYLIEQGTDSLLLDPGCRQGFDETLSRIEQVLPLSHVRWIVCHHQDPDATSALPLIDARGTRVDRAIVTHGVAATSLAGYDLRMPFWLVEENDWQLKLPERLLRFIFTPYAHFPGAFCTLDTGSEILFSAELFGGSVGDTELFADSEAHFEAIRPFHEHFIPSREVLNHAVSQIERYSISMIAPRHGRLIPGHLLEDMVHKLKGLECGLYLMATGSTDIRHLSRLNAALKDITSTMVVSRDFREIAGRLLEILKRELPADSLEFYVQLDDDTVLHLAPESRYRGVAGSPPAVISRLFGVGWKNWQVPGELGAGPVLVDREDGRTGRRLLVLPLFKGDNPWVYGVAVIGLTDPVEVDDDISQIMEQMSAALQVAVERETIFRGIELERQKFYERSIRDPLTGLFTRFYMEDTLRRLFEIHDRSGGTPVALAMLDIDHFKRINDQYGHVRGDEVLCRVAHIIQADARAGDLPVRLGGEEFGLIVVGAPAAEIQAIGERLRQKVAAIHFHGTFTGLRVTISIGTAIRLVGESIPGFIERADLALYQAKNMGRNRVRCADSSASYSGQWSLHFD